jgi:hypothetical protein
MANAAFTCATVLVWLWHTGSHELPTAAQAASQLAPFALTVHVPHEDADMGPVVKDAAMGPVVTADVGDGEGYPVGKRDGIPVLSVGRTEGTPNNGNS